MVKINFEKCTYLFDFGNFSNESIIDFNKGSLLISLILNQKVTKGTSQKYDLNKFDNDNDLYINLSTGFKLPIKAMFFIDNASKLSKIYSFSMSTSYHCNGLKYGTCGAYDKINNINLCYGSNFETCRTNKVNINSIESNFISSFIFRHTKNKDITKYLQLKNIDLIRVNNHGSFIDSKSCIDLLKLVESNKDIKFYTYIEYKKYAFDLKSFNNDNLIINGSNFMCDNCFKITSDLQTYFYAGNKRCLDSCITCKKCHNKLNQTNINLLHGLLKDIDYLYDNESNINFIESFFNFEYKVNDFKGSYLLYRVKNMLKQINHDLYLNIEPVDNIKNYKDLIFYLESNYL